MANTLYDYYTGQGQKLPSVQERSKIYESSGLGSANTYQGNAAQNTALLKSLQTPVDVPTTMNAGDVGNTKDFVTKDTTPTDSAGNFVNGANAGMTEAQRQAAQAKADEQARLKASMDTYSNAQMLQGADPNQATYDQSVQELSNLTSNTIDRAGAYNKALEAGGVNANQTRLNELNAQIAQRNAVFENATTNVQGGTGLTTTIAGKAGLIRRQQAVEIGNLTIEAQALQGNITAAKQTAKDMIDMQYADQQDKIANKKDLIALNYDNLTKSEKKRADALNYALDKEEKKIEEEKQVKNDITSVMIKAVEGGADAITLEKIRNAKTIGEAIVASGEYYSPTEYKTSIETIAGRKVMVTYDAGGNLVKRTDLGSSATGTGNTISDADKTIAKIQDTAFSLLEAYSQDKIKWSEMYDSMKIKFPDMPPDAINEILGGGIPYDPETKTFNTKEAWGRAKK